MASAPMLKARGLQTFNNQLDAIPEGSLIKAENTVIDRQGVIERRKGQKSYGTFGSSSANIGKQLMTYKDRLIAHWDTTLSYDSDGAGAFSDFSGTYSNAESGLRIRSSELNGNLYFTTSDGVKKLSAASASEFSTAYLGDSGAPNALDTTATLTYQTGGFFASPASQYSQVAYRITWCREDENGNFIQGRPSARIVLTNVVSDSAAVVSLTTTIPDDVQAGDYYRIYRTAVDTATSISNLAAGDEMRLVYQSQPFGSSPGTSDTVVDETSDALRAGYENLYVNELTGEGILQSNDQAPFAKDITQYQNSLFLGNTRNKQAISLNLVGANNIYQSSLQTSTVNSDRVNTYLFDVTGTYTAGSPTTIDAANHGLQTGDYIALLDADTPSDGDMSGIYQVTYVDANSFSIPFSSSSSSTFSNNPAVYRDSFCIEQSDTTNRFFFVGRPEQWQYTAAAASSYTTSGTADYTTLYSIGDERKYYLWYNYESLCTDPKSSVAALEGFIGIEVAMQSVHTAGNVASTIRSSIDSITTDFIATVSSSVVTIQTANSGTSSTWSDNSAGSIAQTWVGHGEDTTAGYIRASALSDASQQIDDTARSMVRVINQWTGSTICNAQYTSTETDAPGNMVLTTDDISDPIFYVNLNSRDPDFNNATTFNDEESNNYLFDPILPEAFTGSISSSASNTMTFYSSQTGVIPAEHGLSTGDTIRLSGVNSTYTISGVTTSTITISGSFGVSGDYIGYKTDVFSSSDEAPNRLYFSKYQQPDSFPILNYLDIGPKDKEIIRVQGLRDSLFVFKEDGIYRVSGSVAPNFSVKKHDTAVLIAPDSMAVLNNQIYCLTSQGVCRVTETGVDIISTDIEDKLKRISGESYTNFRTATYGVGYEKDRSYYLATVDNTTDTYASKIYRYNTFTEAWTEWTIPTHASTVLEYINSSGVYINKLFMMPTDSNIITVERTAGTGRDYADREFSLTIPASAVVDSSTIRVSSVASITKGDAIVQTQYLTPYEVERLAKKLAIDPTFSASASDITFYSGFDVATGDEISDKMEELVAQINSDISPSSLAQTTFTADFATCQSEFNTLIGQINSSTAFHYSNYDTSSGSKDVEMIAETVTIAGNKLTGLVPGFIQGPITHYQGIDVKITYAPYTFGDPSKMKQVSHGSLLFKTDNLDIGTVYYNTDLSPGFEATNLTLEGSGNFGQENYDSTTWGGDGTGVPFRTIIPLQKQRCSYIRCQFESTTAFDDFQLLGISYVFRVTGDRLYR